VSLCFEVMLGSQTEGLAGKISKVVPGMCSEYERCVGIGVVQPKVLLLLKVMTVMCSDTYTLRGMCVGMKELSPFRK
jgi:hypothetical protein